MKKLFISLLCILMIFSLAACNAGTTGTTGTSDEPAVQARVGTWKTPQTIQPYFYEDFSEGDFAAEVLPFTNPGDMKTALLAGSLDLCGTTIVTAITAASKGEPVVIVTGLSNRCSALVVAADSNIEKVEDLKGNRLCSGNHAPPTFAGGLEQRRTQSGNGCRTGKDRFL